MDNFHRDHWRETFASRIRRAIIHRDKRWELGQQIERKADFPIGPETDFEAMADEIAGGIDRLLHYRAVHPQLVDSIIDGLAEAILHRTGCTGCNRPVSLYRTCAGPNPGGYAYHVGFHCWDCGKQYSVGGCADRCNLTGKCGCGCNACSPNATPLVHIPLDTPDEVASRTCRCWYAPTRYWSDQTCYCSQCLRYANASDDAAA